MTNNTTELQHHGIPGQKWGVRRYQNKDGSLTKAGKRRVDKLKQEYSALTGKRLIRKPAPKTKGKEEPDFDKKKSIKDMTNAELKEKTDRLNAEKNYVEAMNNHKNAMSTKQSKGKSFVSKFLSEALQPAVDDVGKQLTKSFVTKLTNESLKLEDQYKVYTNNKKKS